MADNLNSTPNANRIHIAFFGNRNAGKSSLVNAVTGQSLSVVSDVKGTTTDAVRKAMELLPIGPVLIIDTPGIDDAGELGEMRVQCTRKILNKTDIAVLVTDAAIGLTDSDRELISAFEKKSIPYMIAYNKCDIASRKALAENEIEVSAKEKINITELKNRLATMVCAGNERILIGDMLNKSDIVVLVTPIDSSAPKGRMILPQMQTVRDVLDAQAICVVTQTEQLETALNCLREPPKMVVTDSQAFEKVKLIVPENVPLTSFSILFARFKGVLEAAASGAASIESLRDGDTVLICEGCTHHRQCGDIGTVKLPEWIGKHTGKTLNYEFVSGGDFHEELGKYALVVHCGGCMLNEREIEYRCKCAEDSNVPFTNYGILIAYLNGILRRSLAVLPEISVFWG